MTSKTFKSAVTGHPRRLHLEENEHGVNVYVSDPEWRDGYGITIAPSDAPALALAILELAGESPLGEARWVNDAKYALGEIAIFRSNKEADAKEQAELEAEALKFYFAFHSAVDRPCQDWDYLDQQDKQQWLAVARRAREMSAGK